jgi:hypothetical protein
VSTADLFVVAQECRIEPGGGLGSAGPGTGHRAEDEAEVLLDLAAVALGQVREQRVDLLQQK